MGLNILHETEGALYLRGNEDREWTLKLELAPEAASSSWPTGWARTPTWTP